LKKIFPEEKNCTGKRRRPALCRANAAALQPGCNAPIYLPKAG